MVNVMLSVDVEIWCGWDRMDEMFPDAYRRYVYGPTRKGDHGLPLQLRMLADHGLRGVFFTEPLFSTRFGPGPLEELVGLIQQGGQEVQLHLHTEWLDESREPLLPTPQKGKRMFLHQYTADEQRTILREGVRLLRKAGVADPSAFRAGAFGMGPHTLRAVADAGLAFDSSYNPARTVGTQAPIPGLKPTQPIVVDGVAEYPMTCFVDRSGRTRQLQIGSCSFQEMTSVLWHAAEHGWDSVIFLFHNFELMNRRKDAPDPIVLRRFTQLCHFLERHRDAFETIGFHQAQRTPACPQPPLPTVAMFPTLVRHAEQVWRRRYR